MNKVISRSLLSLLGFYSAASYAAFDDAGTDYTTAKTAADAATPYTSDASNEVVGLADTMACLMKNSGVGLEGYANKTWVAYVDEQGCNVSDSNGATTYAKMTVVSEMATGGTQDLSVWAEFSSGEHYIVSAQVSSGPDETPPWGLWNFRFYQAGLNASSLSGFSSSTPFYGYASVEVSGNDIQVISSEYETSGDWGVRSKVIAANGSADDISFVGYITDSGTDTYATGKTSATAAYTANIDSNDAIDTTNAACKARDEVWETNWRHKLFNATTGVEYTLARPGFEFVDLDNSNNGNISAQNFWLSGEPRANWSGVSDRTLNIQERYGDLATYDLTLGHGKLYKNTWGSTNFNPNHMFEVWVYDSGNNTQYNVKWDTSNSKFLLYSNGNDATAVNTMITSNLGNQYRTWLWNRTENESYIIDADTSSSTTFSTSGIKYSLSAQKRTRIDGGENPKIAENTAVTKFVCTNGCYDYSDLPISITAHNAGSVSKDWSGTAKTYFFVPVVDVNSSFTSYLPGTLYADNTASGTVGSLDSADKPVMHNFYQPWPNTEEKWYPYGGGTAVSQVNTNTWMSMGLYRVDPTNGDCDTPAEVASTSSCQTVNYEWQTGPNTWDLGTFLVDSNGSPYPLSQPVSLTVTYDKTKDKNKSVAGDQQNPSDLGDYRIRIPYGYWNPLNNSNCSNSSGCESVFSLDDIDGQNLLARWDGQEFDCGGNCAKDANSGDWIKFINPEDGQLRFSDGTNEYVTVAVEAKESLVAYANDSNCNTAGIKFTSVLSGLSRSDIPDPLDQANYPMPTATFDDIPTGVDTSCIVKDGVEICSN